VAAQHRDANSEGGCVAKEIRVGPQAPGDVALAKVSGVLGIVALALAALGPALIHLGALTPMRGFNAFSLGLLAGLLALLTGLIALWLTRPATGRGGRGHALRGALCGAGMIAIVATGAGAGSGLPPVNDITTNPQDPPLFSAALGIPENVGRNMGYDAAALAELTRSAYPDLQTLRLPQPPAAAHAAALAAVDALGWQLTAADAEHGTIEARETSRIFRFVDDVVIRIRGDGDGSALDLRSKSRDGRGDLGANAARIRRFRAAIGAGN
jgi:hypothetical protein